MTETIVAEDLDKMINRAYSQFVNDLNDSMEKNQLMMLVDKHASADPLLRRKLRTYIKAIFEKVIDRETAKMTLDLFYEELMESFRASIDRMDGKFTLGLHGAADSKMIDPPIDRVLKVAYGEG